MSLTVPDIFPSASADAVAGALTQDDWLRCEMCSEPRYFRGRRGLKIHMGKVHRVPVSPSVSPIPTRDNTPDRRGADFRDDSSEVPLWKLLGDLKNNVPVTKRIPRGARQAVASTLRKCIEVVVSKNDKDSWRELLTFVYRTLNVDCTRGSCSLTQKIKNNCTATLTEDNCTGYTRGPVQSNFVKSVEAKMNDGDIKGASNLLFSSDVLAPNSSETLDALKMKHPSPRADFILPDPPGVSDQTPVVNAEDVREALFSFKNGSAAGLDGLSPQHLKDLISCSLGDVGKNLLESIVSLVNLMLAGKVHDEVTQIVYGANLIALKKKDGGIRPIAVGGTFRRLVAKICCKHIAPELALKFQPKQLGFGIKGGCEAAVHATRTFLGLGGGEVLVKVDVKNAFNCIDRGAMLRAVKEQVPAIYPFLWQCYATPKSLVFKDHLLISSTGCQQGDPLGPAIFSLAIHSIISGLSSKLNIWYLDDGTLGGDASSVALDLGALVDAFASVGLQLNFDKCELFVQTSLSPARRNEIIEEFNTLAPGIRVVSSESLRLLGAPIFYESFPSFMEEQMEIFRSSSERLLKIQAHMALHIIRFCLFIPKSMYVLRCTQLWQNDALLQNLDTLVQETLALVLNCQLDETAWSQASLPIRFGGLGIRRASAVSLPAFLSSAHAAALLCGNILNPSLGTVEIAGLAEARDIWREISHEELPGTPYSQRQWDEPLCKSALQDLVANCASSTERARLLAVSERESGLWLHALPSANLGTLLDNRSLSLIVGLRLGLKINAPHQCVCGAAVSEMGYHGLSCQRSAGRWSRHASINDLIRRALVSAGVPSVPEPVGIFRTDGKRPDGMTLIPWKLGKCLVWDATCADTLAPTHLPSTTQRAGAAAAAAEGLKRRKYAELSRNYLFVPFAVETFGPWGSDARAFVSELSSRLREASGDPRAGSYFAQKISMAIQRGNVASLLGTVPRGDALDDLFYL